MLNGYEIILVLVLALIFFGAKKLPDLARGLGQGIREFKRASREVTSEIENMAGSDTYSSRSIPPAPLASESPSQEVTPLPMSADTAKPHGS